MTRSKLLKEQVAYSLRRPESGTAISDVCRALGNSGDLRMAPTPPRQFERKRGREEASEIAPLIASETPASVSINNLSASAAAEQGRAIRPRPQAACDRTRGSSSWSPLAHRQRALLFRSRSEDPSTSVVILH